jgi:hypothetical protein
MCSASSPGELPSTTRFIAARTLLKCLDATTLRTALRADSVLARHGAVAAVCVMEAAGRPGKV